MWFSRCFKALFVITILFLSNNGYSDSINCPIKDILNQFSSDSGGVSLDLVTGGGSRKTGYNADTFGLHFLLQNFSLTAKDKIVLKRDDDQECLELTVRVIKSTIRHENSTANTALQQNPGEDNVAASSRMMTEMFVRQSEARNQGKEAKTIKTRDAMGQFFKKMSEQFESPDDVIPCGDIRTRNFSFSIEQGYQIKETSQGEKIIFEFEFSIDFLCKRECCEKFFAALSQDEALEGGFRRSVKKCPEGFIALRKVGGDCGTVPAGELPKVSFYPTPEEAQAAFKGMKESLSEFCKQLECASSSTSQSICEPIASGFPILDVDQDQFMRMVDINPLGLPDPIPGGYAEAHERLVQQPGKLKELRDRAPEGAKVGRFMSIIENFSCACLVCGKPSALPASPATPAPEPAPAPVLEPPQTENRSCSNWTIEGATSSDAGTAVNFQIKTNFKPPFDWYSFFAGLKIIDPFGNVILFVFNQFHAGVASVGGSGPQGEVPVVGEILEDGTFSASVPKENLPAGGKFHAVGGCMETAAGPFVSKDLPSDQQLP